MWAYQTSVAPSSSLLVKQNWCHAPVPPCTKEQIPIPAAWLMPYYNTVSLSSCSGPSPGFLSTLLRLSWETNALLKAHTGASSWRSWTAGAAWSAGTLSCYQWLLRHYKKKKANYRKDNLLFFVISVLHSREDRRVTQIQGNNKECLGLKKASEVCDSKFLFNYDRMGEKQNMYTCKLNV